MDRRTFLKGSAAAGTLGFLGTSGWFKPLFGQSLAHAAARSAVAGTDNRILVILRLEGGNDGLNMVLPLDQYDNLAKARSNILIPESKALVLEPGTGLHPAMTGLQKAYLDGNLRVVQAVGYPNHNQSHFRSTDIWFTGSDSNQVLETGVLGRYLDGQFPNFPTGYPNPTSPHPPAIEIGSTLYSLLEGATTGMGMAISDPANVYALQSNGLDTAPASPSGHELTFLRQMASQTQKYGETIKATLAAGTNRSALYPATGNNLANQFKGVARLISGGLKTRVYVLSIGGFDTHSGQVSATDNTTGKHADLLRQVSEAITAFMDDLRLQNLDDRVIGMTVSEFGRRILSNSSLGSDHGTAAPMLLFGKPVSGGITGVNPTIPATVTANDNVAMQTDFRSVYASILQQWMGVGDIELHRVMLKDFAPLSLLDTDQILPPSGADLALQLGPTDPYGDGVTLIYTLARDASVVLRIYDLNGRVAATPVQGTVNAGVHQTRLRPGTLHAGRYIASLQWGASKSQVAFDVFR